MNVVITIPVYNEEANIERSVEELLKFCKKNLFYNFKIIIADNKSTDSTPKIGKSLEKKHSKYVKYFYINQKGKGLALKHSLIKFTADVNVFMDADLATDLSALLPLINYVFYGYDIVSGSRYLKQSIAKRTLMRRLISDVYRYYVKLFFWNNLTDFQCGFKAVNKRVVKNLIPKIKDNEFFFDTELMLTALAHGYKVKEIPVYWHEGKQTRVDFVDTIKNHLIKTIQMRFKLWFIK